MSNYTIIQNGFVIDPEKKGIEQREIGIIEGKLADSKDVLEQGTAINYIDAEGAYIAPGFIDLHVHVFKGATTLGIEADLVGIQQGVTTIVDAGSSGCANYQLLKETVIQQSDTEVLAFLNIAKDGLGAGLSELADPTNLMSVEEATEIFVREPQIVGLKARMSGSVVKEQGIAPLKHARFVAGALHKPIMVHIGNPPPYLNEVFPLLGKGDIVTHAFHGKKHGILNEQGYLLAEATEALQRGVLFDVGHGTSSFSYQTLQKFKENYTEPFSISTDIYLNNYDHPVGSLMLTMSKLLELGFTLEEVVRAVTIRAAKAIGLTEQGTLQNGTRADLTIFTLQDERTNLVDSEGVVLTANHVLQPKITVRNGRVVFRQ
ncbi:amidohydrolase/deacetylase family metallohydrolase [Metasolibacillus meyeri]|uniref:amidohydrolase/deacetylase family metallohydrolase n=1 Tax=Metasolibacillus meyeri TaxID=1071052 RepID=UPI00187D42DD|nr:amidohydrolase/deacetylase family metallohydrolase [Metasolibacillus meyeri]